MPEPAPEDNPFFNEIMKGQSQKRPTSEILEGIEKKIDELLDWKKEQEIKSLVGNDRPKFGNTP